MISLGHCYRYSNDKLYYTSAICILCALLWLQRQSNQSRIRHHQNLRIPARRETNDKVKEMKDQLIRAKAYLSFAPPGSNSHLVKELRLRMKELERAMGEVMWDADLSRRYLHHQYFFFLY